MNAKDLYYPYPEIEQFDVVSVNESYKKMIDAFSDERYEGVILNAKSMIESEIKWIYKEINGEDLSDTSGLYTKAKKTIESLEANLIDEKHFFEMLEKQIDIIADVGLIRNHTPESHGGSIRSEKIDEALAKYIAYTAVGTGNFLFTLFFNKTKVMKENAIGSPITPNDDLEFNEKGHMYKDRENNIDYFLEETTGIIRQVIIKLDTLIDINLDSEFLNEHISSFMEDDVEIVRKKLNEILYYSAKRDMYYEIELVILKDNNETLVYITRGYEQ